MDHQEHTTPESNKLVTTDDDATLQTTTVWQDLLNDGLNIKFHNGEETEKTVKVRELLEWVGYKRRRGGAEDAVSKKLNVFSVTTEPDFRDAHIDADVKLKINSSVNSKNLTPASTKQTTEVQEPPPPSPSQNREEKHLLAVGRLEAANKMPVSVKDDDTLDRAIALMTKHNYSQLPIIKNEYNATGLISWKSISKILLQQNKIPSSDLKVSAFREDHVEIKYESSLFDAFSTFKLHDAIIVKSGAKISGIITPTDLSEQFIELSEAFIKIGQIEVIIRTIIEEYYPIEKIKGAKNPTDETREISSVNDLSFGEYKRLLENTNDWATYFKARTDRRIFIDTLEEVRLIRNDIMHFDPDGVSNEQIIELNNALTYFKAIQEAAFIKNNP